MGLVADALTYGASGVVSQVVGFILLPLYTKHLTPADYGVTAMLAIVTSIYQPLANLGIQNAIFRNFVRTKDPEERRRIMSSGLIAVTVASLALFGGAALFAGLLTRALLGAEYSIDLMVYSLLGSVATSVGSIPQSVLRAERRVKTAAVLNVARLLITTGVTIYLVVVVKDGVRGVVVGTLLGEAAIALLMLVMTRSAFGLVFDRPILKKMLDYSLPFVPMRLIQVAFTYFGQWVLANRLSLDDAGLYTVATKLAMPISFIVNAVQQAWVPYKFQIYEEDKEPEAFFRSVTTYYVALLSYLWVGVSLWGPEALRLLTDARYHEAATLIPAVAFIPVALGIRLMIGTGVEMSEDTKSLPLVTLTGLVVTVGATFATLPYLRAAGAALSTGLGWLAMGWVILWFARRTFYIRYDWLSLFGVVGLGAVAVGVAVFAQRLSFGTRIGVAVAGSVAYPIIVGLVLLGSSTERVRVQALVARLRKGAPKRKAQPGDV